MILAMNTLYYNAGTNILDRVRYRESGSGYLPAG